jgi:hypothetical protein
MVDGDEIVVTSDAGFVHHCRRPHHSQLIVRRRTDTDDQEVIAQAWQTANDKARGARVDCVGRRPRSALFSCKAGAFAALLRRYIASKLRVDAEDHNFRSASGGRTQPTELYQKDRRQYQLQGGQQGLSEGADQGPAKIRDRATAD